MAAVVQVPAVLAPLFMVAALLAAAVDAYARPTAAHVPAVVAEAREGTWWRRRVCVGTLAEPCSRRSC